jgi:hypothetical protein
MCRKNVSRNLTVKQCWKGRQQIERCVISKFQLARSMGFKGDFRQWEHLLRIGD